ncbi:tetratricopeptide repeat protein [Methanosarcina hadiensis]|uniref:tetratricopeptide repeat protein n=1 Tax=Methanosarcina hadiensis TaxID=3078083 RepID=UPI0039776437
MSLMLAFLIGIPLLIYILSQGNDKNNTQLLKQRGNSEVIRELKKTGNYEVIRDFVQRNKRAPSNRELQNLKEKFHNWKRIKMTDQSLKEIINLELNKMNEIKLFNEGCRLSNEGKYEEAIEYYDRAISADPRYAFAWYNKGTILLNMGRYQEAMNCFEETKLIDSKLYFKLHTKKGDAKSLINIGYRLLNEGKYDEAIEYYCGAVSVNSNYVDIVATKLFDIACRFSSEKNYEEAIKFYDRVTSIKPTHIDAWSNKGTTFLKMGMNQKATKCFKKADIIKKDIEHNLHLVQIRERARKEREQKREKAWKNRDTGFYLSNEGKYEEAIECYNKALSIDANIDVWYEKGEALFHIGKYQEAIDCYDRSISIEPNAKAWYYKGVALFKLGRYQEGRKCLEKAKNINLSLYLTLERASFEHIDIMSGYEFEQFLGDLYEKMGYSVKYTPLSRDQGADLIVTRNDVKSAIQAKRHKGKVTTKAIQEVFTSKSVYECDSCIVITNSYFTPDAIDLGKKLDVKLINRDELKNMVDKCL